MCYNKCGFCKIKGDFMKYNKVIFNILRRKNSLNPSQQELLAKYVLKSENPEVTLGLIKSNIRTGLMCELAYFRCSTRDDGSIRRVCELTTRDCVKEVTSTEFMLKLVKYDFKNFDLLNFEQLRQEENLAEHAKIILAYGNGVQNAIANYNKALAPGLEYSQENIVNNVRWNEIKEEYDAALEVLKGMGFNAQQIIDISNADNLEESIIKTSQTHLDTTENDNKDDIKNNNTKTEIYDDEYQDEIFDSKLVSRLDHGSDIPDGMGDD